MVSTCSNSCIWVWHHWMWFLWPVSDLPSHWCWYILKWNKYTQPLQSFLKELLYTHVFWEHGPQSPHALLHYIFITDIFYLIQCLTSDDCYKDSHVSATVWGFPGWFFGLPLSLWYMVIWYNQRLTVYHVIEHRKKSSVFFFLCYTTKKIGISNFLPPKSKWKFQDHLLTHVELLC